MLLRMYMRWAEKKGFKVTLIEQTDGEEAGIKSATVEIKGTMLMGGQRRSPVSTVWFVFRPLTVMPVAIQFCQRLVLSGG